MPLEIPLLASLRCNFPPIVLDALQFDMSNSFWSTAQGYLRAANRWFQQTPERALDDAYQAALRIKSIEDTHFGGGRISPDYGDYGSSVRAYFQSELRKYLSIAKTRLAEFRLSSSVLRAPNQSITEVQVDQEPSEEYRISVVERPAVILKKLKFVDEVIARYSPQKQQPSTLVMVSEPATMVSQKNGTVNGGGKRPPQSNMNRLRQEAGQGIDNIESIADKTGVLPRSILKTVDRIKRELDPQAEEEVVENFRSSKARTVISIRLILLLIIVPLLTQQVTKNFVVGPIVDHVRGQDIPEERIFLNIDMEEEALDEMRRYEERLRFESLIGTTPPLTQEQIDERLRERAEEIQLESWRASNNAIKNVFADMASALVFALVLVTNRRDVAVLRSFIDELVYGLSDSAKAFIIILFTDIFVGFHSPHGWEVLLESVARHFGLAANRDFIFLFIATFPVILDTIFKYWIFRYLNRISPSAVATYRNMNE